MNARFMSLFFALALIAVFSAATPPAIDVPVILETGMAFQTKEQVANYFSENFEAIKNAVLEFEFRGYGISGRDEQIQYILDKSFNPPVVFVEDGPLRSCLDGKICSSMQIKYVVYVAQGQFNEPKNGWLYETSVPVSGARFFVDEQGKIAFAFSGKPDSLVGNFPIEVFILIAIIVVIAAISIGYFKFKKK